MIEIVKYISENNLSGNGSTRLMGRGLNAMGLVFHEQTSSPAQVSDLDDFNIPFYTN
jgi:hypothetical protein